MNEEQKEKWYNSFTRGQLIERCEYLQRNCERKENSIMELEMENADLESIIKEVKELLSQNWYAVLRKRTIRQALEILDKSDIDV